MAIGRTRVYVRWISQVWGGGEGGGLHSLMTFVKSRLCLKIQGGLAGLPISIRLIQDFYNGAKLKEPNKCGETIAIVYEHTKGRQGMLFTDCAQKVITQSMFWAQSGAGIRLTVWK